MTVYTASAPHASATWPDPIEPVWQMLPAADDCPLGYKRRDLGLSDRLFIGAVVNLPKVQRAWGCVTWLADVFVTSRPTLYAIGKRTREGLAARPSGRPARSAAPVEASSPVISVTPHRLARTILTLLMPGGSLRAQRG